MRQWINTVAWVLIAAGMLFVAIEARKTAEQAASLRDELASRADTIPVESPHLDDLIARYDENPQELLPMAQRARGIVRRKYLKTIDVTNTRRPDAYEGVKDTDGVARMIEFEITENLYNEGLDVGVRRHIYVPVGTLYDGMKEQESYPIHYVSITRRGEAFDDSPDYKLIWILPADAE